MADLTNEEILAENARITRESWGTELNEGLAPATSITDTKDFPTADTATPVTAKESTPVA
jgi:hypothetical protein